jgi:uncharacterized protein YgiM (DUF1202 family)
MLKPVLTASCLCAATLAQAEPARLSGQQIHDLVAGATIEIDAPLGTRLPVRFTREGQVSGQARDLAPYLGSAIDTGNWWVASDQLCHKWKRWLDAKPQCLQLRRQGRTIYWQSQDGNSGTATVTVPAPVQIAAAPPAAQAEIAKPRTAPEVAPKPAAPVEPQGAADTAADADRQPPAPQARPAVADSSWVGSASAATGTLAGPQRAEPKPVARPEPKPAAQPAFMVVNVAQDDVLNVRSGPSADFAVVGELPPGSRGVTITGSCRSSWCPVVHLSASGWVNTAYLAKQAEASASVPASPGSALRGAPLARPHPFALRDPADAPRTCLTPATLVLLERIEQRFGAVQIVSTCRPGAMIAGTTYPSRHASGNAVDFKAGSRKGEIVEWLVANHRDGGTMTYADMDHIHIDIGRHFVSVAGGPRWNSWSGN